MYSIVLGGVSILFGGSLSSGGGGGGRVSISFWGEGGDGIASVHFIWGGGVLMMLLGGVSISYGGSLFIGGVGHFLGVVFLLAWGMV